MSWYNNTDNTFIDATQTFEGGVGGSSGGNVVINEGDEGNTGNDSTISDLITLKFEDGVFNLYLNNKNGGGVIFINTANVDNKIKIENGKLYLYYDYNPLNSLTIPSGWTDIIDYVIQTADFGRFTQAQLVIVESGLATAGAQIILLNNAVLSLEALTQIHGIRITALENRTRLTDINATQTAQTREQLGNAISDLQNSFFNNTFNANSFNSLIKYLRNKGALFFFAGLIIVVGGSGVLNLAINSGTYIADLLTRKENDTNYTTLINSLQTLADSNAPNKNDIDKIYKDGLSIQELTNTGDLNDGNYEVNIQNGAVIEIKVINGFASIYEVLDNGLNFAVNDIITIPKSDIGGTTGDLIINVTQVYTYYDIIIKKIDETILTDKNIENRQRRRQNIPNKDDFTDGLEIVESSTTEETGEVLDKIEIKLKLDTNQFEYDNTGNLQLKDYNNLALKSYVDTAEQNANIYTDGKVQDILTGECLVSAEDLQKVYNLMMSTGLNYDTNNDYSLSLGYKQPFTQQYYNLISVALKSTPVQDAYTSFNPALFNNDFLGYYPILQRLVETPNIELVKSLGIRINDEKMYAGNLYFKLTDPLQDYKLNKKFEFISHFRPLNVQSIAEYDILQTGVQLGQDDYDLDNYKMRFFVASRRLNFSHNIRITNPVYEIDTTYNHLKQRFLLLLPYATAVGNNFDGARAYSVVINANNNEYFVFGIRNMAFDVPNITDEALKNIALTDDTMGWDMFLHTPKNNPESTTAWVSPVIEMYDTLLPDDPLNVAPSKNVGKIILKFRYIKYNEPTSSWIAINPPDAQVLNSFNLKWRIDFKNNVNILQPDYTEYHNFTSFNLITGTNDSYYEQIIYTSTSPEQMATTYKYVSISLEAKTPLTGNSQLYFNLQDGIRLFNVKIYPYKYTPTLYYTEQLHNIIAPTNLFEDPVDTGRYYRFVLNMDLPNHSIKYYVDDIEYTMPDTGNITLTNQSFPNAPFTSTTQATYEWASVEQTSLNIANNILVIGNIPLTGTLYFNLYNWRFISTGNFMTEAQRQSHNYLRNFKYYSNPVEVPKYLKAKEAYFDTIDFRRLLANGNVVYEELTPAEQTQLLANTDIKNVLTGNSYVNINKLYCDAGTSSGLLIYNSSTKTFNPSYTIVNNTLTFRKQYYNYLNVPTTYYDLVTIGEHPDSSSANFARVNIKGEINTVDIKISNNLTFQRDIVVGNNTYTILGGRFENFFNEETGEYFTTCFVKDLVADTARISSLKVNDFQVQGTIGQPNSAIPTLLATPSQTTARKTYGSSLDAEPAVYSTYYNKYTNDIEIYGMILRDGSYIATANDIKTIINLNNYQLISSAFNGDYNNLLNKPTLFDGNYNSLTNKPILFDGNYNNLINKPDLTQYSTFSGSYTDLTNKPTLFSGSYIDLTNKPDLTQYSTFSGSYIDLTNKPTLFDGNYNNLTNKPTLFSGSYIDLTNKPTLFDGNYNNLTNKPTLFSGAYVDLTGKPDLTQYALTTSLNTTNNNVSALDTRVTTLETTGVDTAHLTRGMIVQTKHLTYRQMDVKNNLGWEAINDDINTGFVIAIQPTNVASKILVNTIIQIGTNSATDSRWWGVRLYRKIGTGAWTHISDADGTETGAGAVTNGTPVWITNNMGMTGSDYQYFLTCASGTYLDSPNTTQMVYYTLWWNSRIGDGANNASGNFYLNRANTQNDAYRPAPSSSWTASEIWDLGTIYSAGADTTDLSTYNGPVKLTTLTFADNSVMTTAFDGNYNSLTNKPTLFSGSYTDLTNKPTLFDGNYNSLTNKPTLFSGSYIDLTSKPDLSVYQLISTAFDGNYNNLTNKPVLFSGSYIDLTSKPDLSVYQLISNAFDGNYNSLTNKPDLSVYQLISTAFDGNYNSLTNKPVLFSGSYIDLTDKPDLSVYQLISTAFDGDFNNLTNRPSYYPIHPAFKYDIAAANDAIYIRKLSTSTCVGILKGDPIYTLDVGGTLRCNGFYSTSYINNANFSMNDNATNAIMRINASEAGKSIIQMATPNQGTFDTGFTNKCNVVLQAIGKNTYGRADFVIGVGNSASNLNIYDPADTYFQRFRIYYNSYTEIFGTGSTATSLMRYFYVSGGLYYSNTYLTDCALRVNGSILSTSWFASSSSIKIKKDVEDLDDAECLNKLLLLKPCKYRYIDETKNFDANKKVYGFIAEEVKEVLPEAVDDTTPSLIPNIYMIGSVNNNILTLEKELELNIEYTCYIEGGNDEDGNPTAPEIKIKVLKKLDENTYEIDKELNGRIFVYGKIEEKFNSLKKEYFHALTISAVQELHRTITRQQQEINDLKNKLNSILAHLGL